MIARKGACSLLLLLLGVLAGCRSDSGQASQQSSPASSSAETRSSAEVGSASGSAVSADVVKIGADDQKRAGIQVTSVLVKSMPQVMSVVGQVAMDEKRTNHIGALADGRVETVLVLPGDVVRRGQVLATIHSHTVHETVAALTQAYAAVDRQKSAVSYAAQARDRYAKLYSIQAASLEEKQRSEQDLAQAQKDLTDAEAMMIAEREHLAEILQVTPASLEPGTLYRKELVPVLALADGVVISRNITPGQVVTTGDELLVTSNLATVWVNAAVNERDVPRIYVGKAASVSLPSGGGASLAGKVTMIGDVVDPQTRTLPVRILVSNPGSKLRPGMFVTASITQPDTRTATFVPQDALQDVNGFRVVFTTADGVNFRATPVKTGALSGDMVEITDGLKPGDRVVSGGAFMVKGEMLKGSVGEG
jgi:multidrug efflux pump subunit AcrA (membrane-fusion protein)